MCTRPKRLSQSAWLPCGDCFECRMRKANDWATRLMCEVVTTPPAFFVTLTYSDEFLPIGKHGPTFFPPHHETLFREMRRGGHSFRYYLIAEHGTDFHRPHYHFMCFGYDHMRLYNMLERYWPYGYYEIGNFEAARAMYLALFHVLKSWKYRDEYVRMSRNPGLGAAFIDDEKFREYLFHSKTGEFIVLGERRLVPRYFVDRIGDDGLRADIKDYRRKKAFERLSKFAEKPINDFIDYEIVFNEMSEDKLSDYQSILRDIDRRKTQDFKQRHRKSRHVE